MSVYDIEDDWHFQENHNLTLKLFLLKHSQSPAERRGKMNESKSKSGIGVLYLLLEAEVHRLIQERKYGSITTNHTTSSFPCTTGEFLILINIIIIVMVKITTTSYLLFSSSATAVPSITVNLDQDISSFSLSLFHSSCVNIPFHFYFFSAQPWVTTTCYFHCLIWVKISPKFSFSFHFSTWVMTSPHFHFHFFSTRPELRQLFIPTYPHESGHLLIFTFSIQPKLRSLSTFTFFNWSQDICSLSLSLFSNGVCQPQLYLGHTTTELFRSEIEKG